MSKSRTKIKKGHYGTFAARLNFLLTKVTNRKEFLDCTKMTGKRLEELLDAGDPMYSELQGILSCHEMLVEKWLLTGQGVPIKDNAERFKQVSDYSDICERFRRERLDHDYTQEEWAAIFNRARATIAAIETNRQAFPFDVARIWHEKFGRSYSYIIDGVEEDASVPKLIDKIKKLEQDKEFLKEMLRKK